MAVKHFTGRSLDAPDPDCVFGNDDKVAVTTAHAAEAAAAAQAAE